MSSESPYSYKVVEARCIRCGACSSLAPRVFVTTSSACDVQAEPEPGEEAVMAEVALLNCPSNAIQRRKKEQTDG